jgi:hypothetical protein
MMIRVFISYGHDSGAHAQRVLGLADQLRADGLDVRLDQYVAHPSEGWPQWTERQVVECEFVLLVCTPTYRRRYDREETPGNGLGATWEALIAERLRHEAGARTGKLVPVLFEDGSDEDIPLSLRSSTYHRIPDGYEDLYRRLTGEPKAPAPPIGPIRQAPTAQRPGFPARPAIDNRGANIGQQVVVAGSASFGPISIAMPTAAPAPAPVPVPATPATILLCTANAVHQDERIQLEEELRAIDDALRRSRLRDGYEPRMCPAVTFSKVLHELADHNPRFVHFAGHGDPSGQIVLLGERGHEMRVAPEHMADLLAELRPSPTLVTFATCYSYGMAQAAARHAAFAIGFQGPLGDESAPLFSATLYERLASSAEPDVPKAFRLARLACLAAGHQSVELARLFERPGREIG